MNNNISRKRLKSKKTGFTLIELLVVTTIIILLTTIGLISYRQASIRSRNAKRKADLETVRQALMLYRSEKGSYPVGSNFNFMIGDLRAGGYLSNDSTTFEDPSSDRDYTYTSADPGTTFIMSATLEPGSETYELTNP